MQYPVLIVKANDGTVSVSSRDIPEFTGEFDSEEAFNDGAHDLLKETLEKSYRRDRLPIPMPSAKQEDESVIHVNLRTQSKILFWNALCDRHINLKRLSELTGTTPANAQRFVDLTKDCAIDRIEDLMAQLGIKLNLSVAVD